MKSIPIYKGCFRSETALALCVLLLVGTWEDGSRICSLTCHRSREAELGKESKEKITRKFSDSVCTCKGSLAQNFMPAGSAIDSVKNQVII